jgi:hypothetical protein
MFWKPNFTWNNIILKDDVEAKLVPSVVEDLGFTTRVSQNASDVDRSPGLDTSLGFQKYKVRGHFEADFLFQKFPFDVQELNITLMMNDLPLRKAKFITRADSTPAEIGAGDLPLWETTCVSATVDVTDESEKGYSFQDATDDPFSSYIQELQELSPNDIISEKYCHVDLKALNTTDIAEKETIFAQYEQYSTITLTIQIQRKPHFYMYNFVLVVSLLVFVSFFSFHMPKDGLGERLGLTLTIVLGLNVFQIVIIDNMPTTGYLTSMHCFLLIATMIVLGVAIENLLVFVAHKRRRTIGSAAKMFFNNKNKKKKYEEDEDAKEELEMTDIVLGAGGGKKTGGDIENVFGHENPLRNLKKKGTESGEALPSKKDERENLATKDRKNISSDVTWSLSRRWFFLKRPIRWVDENLDTWCEFIFPILFGYAFYILTAEGEPGDEGVVENRCRVNG